MAQVFYKYLAATDRPSANEGNAQDDRGRQSLVMLGWRKEDDNVTALTLISKFGHV